MSPVASLRRDPILWIGAAALVAVSLPFLLPGMDPDWVYSYAELVPPIPLLLVCILGFEYGLGAVPAAQDRRFWRLWTAAFALMLVVRITYVVVPFEEWGNWHDLTQDILYVLSYFCIILALDTRPDLEQPAGAWGRLRRLENAGVGLLLAALLVYLVVIPGALNRELYDTWVPSMVLYVALEILVFVRVVRWFMLTTSPHWRLVAQWLAASSAVWLATDVFETLEYMELAPTDLRGTALDLPWYIPYATALIAARLYHRQRPESLTPTEGAGASEPRERLPFLGGSLVVAAFILPVVHFSLHTFFIMDPGSRPAREVTVLVGLLALLGLAFAHQVLMERENIALGGQKRRAEEIRDLLVAAVEQTGESVIITDTDGLIEYVNPAFERSLGYPRGEVMGRDPTFLLGGTQAEEVFREVSRTLAAGDAWEGRLMNRRKDGSLAEQTASAAPVKDEQGQVIRYVVVQRDITRELHLERRLHQAQKMEALGTLAGGVSHDFNNILQAITGYADLAKEHLPVGSEGHEHIGVVLTAAERARGIVQQIVSFSRSSEPSRQPTDVAQAVREVRALLRASLPSTIELRVDIARDAGSVLADPHQLQRVLLNLGANASQAIGSDPGHVTISAERTDVDSVQGEALGGIPEGSYVCIAVSDDGKGMDARTLERIYEPFFTTKDVGGGTGLGLSVVHGMVHAHGGTIDVESTPGRGTTFRTYLPSCGTAQADTLPTRSEATPTGQARHILVVDDEAPIVLLAQRQLERLGYTVDVARTGDEALALFRESPDAFDAVLTDQTMPGRTGSELAKEVKRVRPSLPIVLMTGLGEVMAAEGGPPEGVNAVLPKPYSARQLAEMMDEMLSARLVQEQ